MCVARARLRESGLVCTRRTRQTGEHRSGPARCVGTKLGERLSTIGSHVRACGRTCVRQHHDMTATRPAHKPGLCAYCQHGDCVVRGWALGPAATRIVQLQRATLRGQAVSKPTVASFLPSAAVPAWLHAVRGDVASCAILLPTATRAQCQPAVPVAAVRSPVPSRSRARAHKAQSARVARRLPTVSAVGTGAPARSQSRLFTAQRAPCKHKPRQHAHMRAARAWLIVSLRASTADSQSARNGSATLG